MGTFFIRSFSIFSPQLALMYAPYKVVKVLIKIFRSIIRTHEKMSDFIKLVFELRSASCALMPLCVYSSNNDLNF